MPKIKVELTGGGVTLGKVGEESVWSQGFMAQVKRQGRYGGTILSAPDSLQVRFSEESQFDCVDMTNKQTEIVDYRDILFHERRVRKYISAAVRLALDERKRQQEILASQTNITPETIDKWDDLRVLKG